MSLSSSSTFLPSATVRMMTPKLFGLMLWMSFFNRLRSSLLCIFCDTDTLLENGTNTTYLPAKEISAVIRGPFVLIGSLAICTGIWSPACRKSVIFPDLSMSASNFMLSMYVCAVLPSLAIFEYCINERICGPRSK